MIKDAKGKNVGKTLIIIHYFNDIDQYRIESSPVITGELKKLGNPLNFTPKKKDPTTRCCKKNKLAATSKIHLIEFADTSCKTTRCVFFFWILQKP